MTDISILFRDRLSSRGLLRAKDQANSSTENSAELPTPAELAQSFEDEVSWAVKRVEAASQKVNPLVFTYNQLAKLQ